MDRSILTSEVGAGGERQRSSTTSTPVLVGALGSVEEDLRRHGICALAPMAGSTAYAMTMV
jgi:hypothetical protein